MPKLQNDNKFNMLNYQYQARDINLPLEKTKEEKLKERIFALSKVNNLEDARELVLKILPTKGKVCRFFVGNASCTIVNKDDLLRVTYNSKTEFITYNFE